MAVSVSAIMDANMAAFQKIRTTLASGGYQFESVVVNLNRYKPDVFNGESIRTMKVARGNRPVDYVDEVIQHCRNGGVTAQQFAQALYDAGFQTTGSDIRTMISGYVPPAVPTTGVLAAVSPAAASEASGDDVIRVRRKVPMPHYVLAVLQNGKVSLIKTAENLEEKVDAIEYLQASLDAPKYKGAICGYFAKADGVNTKAKRYNLVEHATEIEQDPDQDEAIRKKTTEIRIKAGAADKLSKASTEVFEIEGQEHTVITGGTLPLFLYVFQRADGSRFCVTPKEPVKNYESAKSKLSVVKKVSPNDDLSIYIHQASNEEEDPEMEIGEEAVVTVARRGK